MSASPSIASRLSSLRQLLERHGVQAFIVPTADPHQSEYVPGCWQRRTWISGFTGSTGFAWIDMAKASLWTDSRYFLQAEAEHDPSCFELVRQGAPGTPEFTEWLSSNVRAGQAVGIDPQTVSVELERKYRAALEKAGATLVALEENPIDALWTDRPARSAAPVLVQADAWTGETAASKLARVREAMAKEGCTAHPVTMLDAVAWLFNLRGRDVEYNPVFIAHAIVTADRAQLFVDPAKLGTDVRAHLPADVEVRPYEEMTAALDAVGSSGGKAWVDPSTASAWILARLKSAGAKVHEARSPLTLMKSRKNAVEVAGARDCHVRDGVAMARFLSWLEGAWKGLTEVSAADRLEAFRAEGAHFQGLSFPSISGMGAHGAIVHYRPTAESDVPLEAGLYLIDSGAQYLDGTTDITRTVTLGAPSEEQRDRFTRVLRGHVALARQVFPAGTTGKQLDVLARAALWDAGLNYGHGTGHGVGAHLNVHEGPQGIAPKAADVPLEPGMIVSNEPGYYATGKYGIRIENLVVVADRPGLGEGGEKFLGLDTITCCPIDRRLVDTVALLPAELAWLNDYHRWVRETLSPHLDSATRAWLDAATAPLA